MRRRTTPSGFSEQVFVVFVSGLVGEESIAWENSLLSGWHMLLTLQSESAQTSKLVGQQNPDSAPLFTLINQFKPPCTYANELPATMAFMRPFC